MASAFEKAQSRLLDRVGVHAESTFVSVDAVEGETHVLVSGSGPPVVLVPGFGDPAAMWAPLLAHLGEFTTYAVDRPCFGLTGPAELRTDSMPDLASRFLVEVLDALELQRPSVIGNSVGSRWLFWLATDHPDRVASMTHIGCPAFLLDTTAPLPMRLLSIRPLGWLAMALMRPTRRSVEKFAAAVPKEDLSQWPELSDLLAVMQRRKQVRKAMRTLVRAMTGLRRARRGIALGEETLATIEQPNLLVWGENDPFGAVDRARKATELLPDARLHVVTGAGHAPWINHAREVADVVVPFVNSTAGQR